MDTNIVDLATRVAVLKALQDALRTEYDTARADVDDALRALHQSLGVTQMEVRLPGHPGPVAQITLSASKPVFRVNDAAFLAWCQAHHPTEVETITAIRPVWRKTLLARVEAAADGRVLDGKTGQVLDFLTVVESGPPGTTLTFKTGGRDEVARACGDGRFNLADVLPPAERQRALPAVDDGLDAA